MKTTKTKKTVKPHRTHGEATIESFRRDPKFAATYLNAILKDGGHEELMVGLRYVTAAFGGVSSIAEKTNLNGTTLYRTFSASGNPRLKNFAEVLRAMGMRLSVESLTSSRH
ncbi:addiction module antidote protein [Candidatus Kaiserbacteria bacterium]|nr:addiction module antidote protein [Candidatus Kaiserbacteria bacterium]